MFWCALFSLLFSTCTSQSNKTSSLLIGIDLGTTYSCVGIFRDGKVEIIPNDQGNRITPSYVAFTATGERLIGDSAKNQVTLNPENTIFDVKRLVGRKFSDATVQSDMTKLPYKIINKNDRLYIQVADKLYTPEEISGMVLSKMKETAEKYLGEPVKDAIITVPAYFNDAQRQATKDAGTIAGLNVVRIINEPTAAAIAYGVDKKMKERNVLVYDLGGGTFDVTLLTIDDGVFEVLATNGDTHLGGEDFDHNVIDHFVKIIKKKQGLDIRSDPKAIQKLRREVEKAKRALSSQHQVTLEIEDLFQQNDFSEVLSRARFEALNNELFKKTLIPVQTVLDDAGLKASDVDEVILVGGSTRIPLIQTLVKDFFNGMEPARGVNPDEAVAVGAAIQGGVLSGQGSEILLLDVTPLSLGIETMGGVMSKLINKNTVIPTKRQSVFSTAADNQPGVDIRVFQGEREQVKFNKEIGNFHLSGIPPAPRGSPQIEVTFEIDANGILTVSANDKSSKSSKSLVIESTADRLSKEEIDAMVKDATDFAEEDRIFKDKTDAYNKFEAATYQLSAQLKDDSKLGGKLEAEDKKALEAETSSALDWLNTNKAASLEEINKRLSQFESVVHPITSKFASAEPNPSSEEL